MFPFPAGPAIPSVGHPKRSQTTSVESEHKEEGSATTRKSSSSGSRGMGPPSPMLGNANNPNKADIPDRKKSSGTPGVRRQLLGIFVYNFFKYERRAGLKNNVVFRPSQSTKHLASFSRGNRCGKHRAMVFTRPDLTNNRCQ